MTADIEVGYPRDYYQLRRRVSQEIREQISSWVFKASTDKPATSAEIRDWARELSVRSGIPSKGIERLFLAINPKTQEWFS